MDAAGNKVDSRIQVSNYDVPNATNTDPIITVLKDESYVVAWNVKYDDHSKIQAQRYNSSGLKLGNTIDVSQLHENCFDPSITDLPDGFIVTWTNSEQEVFHNFAQIFKTDGSRFGEIFIIDEQPYYQDHSLANTLSDGSILITWDSDTEEDGESWDISAQVYDQNGDTITSPFTINSITAGAQEFPANTELADGGYIVTWLTDRAIALAQRYDSSHIPLTPALITLKGTAADDTMHANENVSRIEGGSGIDTVIFQQNSDEYSIDESKDDKIIITNTITGKEIELFDIETLQFPDINEVLPLKISGLQPEPTEEDADENVQALPEDPEAEVAIATVTGNFSDYTISSSEGTVSLEHKITKVITSFENVEQLKFEDLTVNLKTFIEIVPRLDTAPDTSEFISIPETILFLEDGSFVTTFLSNDHPEEK